jgi:hypothetical protein
MRCIPGQAQSRGHNGNFPHKVPEKPSVADGYFRTFLFANQSLTLLDDVGCHRAVLSHRDLQARDQLRVHDDQHLLLARRRAGPAPARWLLGVGILPHPIVSDSMYWASGLRGGRKCPSAIAPSAIRNGGRFMPHSQAKRQAVAEHD